MAKPENLPKGFWRSPAGSLRVQIRVKGHKVEVKTFPLFADAPYERRQQRLEAEAWALETRQRLHGGTHVSTRDAAKLTLADALRRYERDKLEPGNSNHKKDINRVKAMLDDPIAQRSVASLRPTDMATYRDDLVRRGWLASVADAVRRAEKQDASKARLNEIRNLERLQIRIDEEDDPQARRLLIRQREAVEGREGIKGPARTTISNKTQLITRALGYAAEKMDGVPDLTGTPMPSASPGRERRLRDGEEEKILAKADGLGGFLSLGIRLAIETTLRRERVLEVAPSSFGRHRRWPRRDQVSPRSGSQAQAYRHHSADAGDTRHPQGHRAFVGLPIDRSMRSRQASRGHERQHVRSPVAGSPPRLRHRRSSFS